MAGLPEAVAAAIRAAGEDDGPVFVVGGFIRDQLLGRPALDIDLAVETVGHAIDAGSTLLDTSDAYGTDGANERLIARAVGSRRDEVQVATKWGISGPGETSRQVPHAHD